MARAVWGVFALVLLCVVPTDATGLFEWRGGTMSFDESENWDGPVPDTLARAPCATVVGSATATLIPSLGPKRYFVGRQLVLNRVSLRMSQPGSSIAFSAPAPAPASPPACTTNTTLDWVGGIAVTDRNDFYCHENWLDNGFPAASPPCANSPVLFDPQNTYRIGVSPSVRMLVAGSITFGSTVVSDTSRLSALLPQIDLVHTSATTYLGVNAFPVCAAALQTNAAQCVCFSSCPTTAMLLQYQEVTRAAAAQQASQQMAASAVAAVRVFNGTFTPAALGVSAAALALNLQNQTQVGLLAAAVQHALAGLPAWSVAMPTLLTATAGLRVAGSLNCSAGALYLTGTTTMGPLVWAATVLPAPAATALQNLIATTLSPLLAAHWASTLAAQAANSTAALPPAVADAVAQIAAIGNASAALTVANSQACFAGCTSDCATCVAALSTELQQALNLSAAAADSIATALATAKNDTLAAGGDWSAVSSDATTAIAAQQSAAAAAAAAAASAPVLVTLRTGVLGVGRTRTVAEQLRALMPENRATLTATFLAAIAAAPGMLNASNIALGWTADFAAARRSTGGSAITVQADYSRMCVPGDAACLVPAAASNSLGITLTTLLNQGLALMAVTAPTCQVLSGANAGFNTTCLRSIASSVCSELEGSGASEVDARLATEAALLNLTRCGTQPVYPNGTCLDAAEAATGAALAAQIALSAACFPPTAGPTPAPGNGGTGASASGSSGGMSLPIIGAAAGGGVLLLIAIVVGLLVLRHRRRTSPSTPAKSMVDRTVVAFENPMYDEDKAVSSPTYQTAMGDEGLYDQPAFHLATSKENPVYQSNEDLAPQDGYLDVAPGAVGQFASGPVYAMGAAQEPVYSGAEDVGYLQNEPTYDNRHSPIAHDADWYLQPDAE